MENPKGPHFLKMTILGLWASLELLRQIDPTSGEVRKVETVVMMTDSLLMCPIERAVNEETWRPLVCEDHARVVPLKKSSYFI